MERKDRELEEEIKSKDLKDKEKEKERPKTAPVKKVNFYIF